MAATLFLLWQALTVVMSASMMRVRTVEFGNEPTPQHVHIAYGDLPTTMIVTWSTVSKTSASQVIYGTQLDKLVNVKVGGSELFVDGGSEKRSQFIHRVDLEDLMSNTTYFYRVGCGEGWSQTFTFRSMPHGEDWGPKLAVYGDLGLGNAQSLPRLELDAAIGRFDAILHVGDFAYNMASNNARVGDAFMQMIEPLSASIPYMTCVGNHEGAYNFSNYRARFNMPNDNKKMYYSFNMGPVHFVSISTELLYFARYGFDQIFDQYDWLVKDLKEANLPENRNKRPWIVTFGHRPMYCSNKDGDDCTNVDNLVRVGVPRMGIKGMEKLFYDQGVDLAIWAHEHSYERLWPLYDFKVKNGSYEEPYTNPKGITHIITGSAGCSERHDPFGKKFPFWSAFHSYDYGYTRMHFANKTHLFVEQVSDDKNGAIIDHFTLTKTKHGPYGTSDQSK